MIQLFGMLQRKTFLYWLRTDDIDLVVDQLFSNYVKTCWTKNLKTIEQPANEQLNDDYRKINTKLLATKFAQLLPHISLIGRLKSEHEETIC